MKPLKAYLKSVIPDVVLQWYLLWIYKKEAQKNKNQTLRQIFSDIYSEQKWDRDPSGNSRYFSGLGSQPQYTISYEHFVLKFLETRDQIDSNLDIGCGDFQVSHRILGKLSRRVHYIGIDIVPDLIAFNTATFGGPDVAFHCKDMVSDTLPKTGLILVRQVLQHHSNDYVHRALKNLARSADLAIITEEVPLKPRACNLDIVSGGHTRILKGSGLFPDQAPFGLPVLEEIQTPTEMGTILRTVVVELKQTSLEK